MIAIIDYGVGNIFSLYSSFKYIGADVVLTDDEEVIRSADKIILPGVGAFEDAAKKLREKNLDKLLMEMAESGKPILGICLGMQLLLELSYEYGKHQGLGLIKGDVVPIKPVIPENYKIPHIGWNALKFPADKPKSKLYKYVNDGECVYFVHSYYCSNCDDSVTAFTEYGTDLTASVESNNVYGVQFHPEKSGETGLNILRAYTEL